MVKEINMFNLTVKFIIKILRKLQRLFKLGKNSNCHYAYDKKTQGFQSRGAEFVLQVLE